MARETTVTCDICGDVVTDENCAGSMYATTMAAGTLGIDIFHAIKKPRIPDDLCSKCNEEYKLLRDSAIEKIYDDMVAVRKGISIP